MIASAAGTAGGFPILGTLTSMRMPRGPDRRSLAAGLAIAIALLAAGGGQSAQAPVAPEDGAAAWRGFVDGDRPRSRSGSG